MKKLKIIILLITIISLALALAWLYNNEKNKNKQEIIKITQLEELGAPKEEIIEIIEKSENELEREKQIEQLKNKYAARWLILSWDTHIENYDYTLALRSYIKASAQNRDNENIKNKIGDTYFLMKKWDEAYTNYSKIESRNIVDKDKKVKSFLYSKDFSKTETLTWIINELNNFNLNPQELFYYKNSIFCIYDFHECKENFQDFFENEDIIINDEKLLNIKQAIDNYNNFQLEELYYKNTLIIWAFLQNELYPISAILWKEILKEKTKYKPLIKIVAQSYYELNDIKETKKYLWKYYELDSKDLSVTYMLGILSQKLHDFLLSNIYLTKALKLWYEPKEDIYRIQIYNSYMLSDTKRIISNFDKLINSQEKPEFNDLILATYYNLINWNTSRWIELTKIWIEQYPDKEDFYWFSWWILLDKWEYNLAKKVLLKWYQINKENALIALNLWKAEKSIWENIKALIYFKRAAKLDNGWEISKIAEKELNIMKEINKK